MSNSNLRDLMQCFFLFFGGLLFWLLRLPWLGGCGLWPSLYFFVSLFVYFLSYLEGFVILSFMYFESVFWVCIWVVWIRFTLYVCLLFLFLCLSVCFCASCSLPTLFILRISLFLSFFASSVSPLSLAHHSLFLPPFIISCPFSISSFLTRHARISY